MYSYVVVVVVVVSKTTCVVPPHTDQVDCRPLYFLNVLGKSVRIRVPNRCFKVKSRAYKRFVCSFPNSPMCNTKKPNSYKTNLKS